jgi:hypothetical protein
MDWQGMIGGLLNQYVQGRGATNRQEARDHYDQISGSVPKDLLGSIIGPALSSLGTEQVKERIFNSATEMDTQQRAGFFQNLLSGFQASGTDPLSLLSRLGISSTVADDPGLASPEDVAKLAAHAQLTDPSIFDRAMSFYAEHPTLVKVLGTMAVAAIAKQLYNKSSGEITNQGGNRDLERLRNKYQPVLTVMEQQRVRLTNLHVENGKLVLVGKAPSIDAANRVWDQIKLFPDYAKELIVDIKAETGTFGF